jgi:hypothetical protein
MRTSILIAILLFISLLIDFGSAQKITDGLSASNSSVGFLTMQVTSIPGTNHHEETDVYVTKSAIASGSLLKLKYDIETPPVNDFDFVLALDSSGSMATSEESDQSIAVAKAVPDFINETRDMYKNMKYINMSIISWNDKIDFAYSGPAQKDSQISGFDNKDPRKAYPVQVKDVPNDLASSHVFGLINNKQYKYYCNPSSHTNLSVAIKASMDILNNSNNSIDLYRRPVKFIILVTGESEYERCSDDLIRTARKLGYSIYTIEMKACEISDSGVMLQHLREITGDVNKKPGAPDKAVTCKAPNEFLPKALKMKLKEALTAAIAEPVATNVTISESFYDYIVPNEDASVEILKNPGSYTKITYKPKNDIVALNLPYDLPENNTTEVTLDCSLALRALPVSVGNNPIPEIFTSRGNTTSHIQYTWLKTHPIDKYLPEISMNIESAISKSTTTAERTATAKSAGSEFGLMTLLSFVVLLFISRLKR